MSHRRLSNNYSEKLDTTGDVGLPKTQEISELFLNYLKAQSISESDCLSRSQGFLKKLQTAIILFSCYEAITFFGCLTVLIISLEFKLVFIAIGLFFKLLTCIYLILQAKKQIKCIGSKSTITRKIFLEILKSDKTIDPENRVEIRLVDFNVATKLTIKKFIQEFTIFHRKSFITVLIITIVIYVLYFNLIIQESKVNQYLIFSEFALITLPLTLTIITMTLLLLFLFINCFINLIDMIVRLFINMFTSLPRLIRFLLMIFKIKKENRSVLMKYVHTQHTSKDICSICLCSFQSQCILLPCQHLFHIDCIEKWFFGNNSCPICRAKINNNDDNQQK
ncbi:unnamed protein product (macronuclear) [Paramecium tetraurelia]|uniref:RING-type E3 ubiquitin transferase n=1 Tax=Paramecium tetraurelia TaxID=5888 RepID=A0DQD0_PARTE|nr:uncharacterized protein GSPATT00002647001 [Paramecium tetraurelia]CAK85247.1 unnamed protein product [Paramecium tetraurelia]|eukprot:XP_001452644.1 hypothetical protein (macronuclear) [Paramecium tetraurelia strain d4-2]